MFSQPNFKLQIHTPKKKRKKKIMSLLRHSPTSTTLANKIIRILLPYHDHLNFLLLVESTFIRERKRVGEREKPGTFRAGGGEVGLDERSEPLLEIRTEILLLLLPLLYLEVDGKVGTLGGRRTLVVAATPNAMDELEGCVSVKPKLVIGGRKLQTWCLLQHGSCL